MSADQEVIVLELRRGRRGKIVISRVKDQGDRYTRLAMMYPVGDADEAPLKRGASLSIRGADEHDQMASVFAAIAKKERAAESFAAAPASAAAPPQSARAAHAEWDLEPDPEGLF